MPKGKRGAPLTPKNPPHLSSSPLAVSPHPGHPHSGWPIPRMRVSFSWRSRRILNVATISASRSLMPSR